MTPAARKEYLDKRAKLSAQMDTWFNPMKVEQRLKLVLQGDTPTTIPVPPGGRVQIPAIHREAIHTVHNDVVVGGQAPMLVNESLEKRPTVHQEHADANAKLMLTKDEIEDIATAPAPKKK